MKNQKTDVIFILDKSGSMQGLEADTIGGYNSFLQKQKALEGEASLTTVFFNDRLDQVHNRVDLKTAPMLTARDYVVGGTTALLDALGLTLQRTWQALGNILPQEMPDQVIVVIITDGYENASRYFTLQDVKADIQRAKHAGWEFIFLGANIDAVETADQFGISQDRALNYMADHQGTTLTYQMMSDTVAQFREKGIIDENHLDAIRLDVKKRGGH